MNLKSILSTLVLVLSLTFSQQALAAKSCKKGQPCGNACISKEDVCHITESGNAKSAPAEKTEVKETAPAPSAPAANTQASSAQTSTETTTTKVKVCKKGKACGNACIPAKAVCHAK